MNPTPTPSGCYFDERAANKPIEFIEKLKLFEAEFTGKQFKLMPFQKDIIRDIYGWKTADGYRLRQEAFISFARKNGKTALIAGLALFALFYDTRNEMAAQIYSAASDKDQASIIFRMMVGMIEQNATLRAITKITPSKRLIQNTVTGGMFRSLSADGKGKHGYNPSMVILDELHTWSNRELYDALTSGSGARRQSLKVMITTAGTTENSIWGEQYKYSKAILDGKVQDPARSVFIYEVPLEAEWKDENTWKLANPALGVITKIETLRQEFTKAEYIPSEQGKFRRLYLNQLITDRSKWLDYIAWQASGESPVDVSELLGRPCYAGLDLSAKDDLTALVLVFPFESKTDKTVYKVLPFFFIPQETIRRHMKSDKVPYDQWVKDGHIIATPGEVIDYEFVRAKVYEVSQMFDLRELAFDRQFAGQLSQEIHKDLPNCVVIPFGQGYYSMSQPTKDMRYLVLQKRLIHGNHPVLNFNAQCAEVEQDAAENIKLVKPERRKDSARIDGLVALVMALGRAMLNENAKKESVYEQRGVFVL